MEMDQSDFVLEADQYKQFLQNKKFELAL